MYVEEVALNFFVFIICAKKNTFHEEETQTQHIVGTTGGLLV